MQGFLSTSLKQKKAAMFGNDLLVIKVPVIKKSHNFFHSFAYVGGHSYCPKEE